MIKKWYYTIGNVADIVGVQASTIRFWEDTYGKLHSKRVKVNTGLNNDVRRFTELDIQRIKTIKALTRTRNHIGVKEMMEQLDFSFNEQ